MAQALGNCSGVSIQHVLAELDPVRAARLNAELNALFEADAGVDERIDHWYFDVMFAPESVDMWRLTHEVSAVIRLVVPGDDFWTQGDDVTDEGTSLYLSPSTTAAMADALRGLGPDDVSELYEQARTNVVGALSAEHRPRVEQLVVEIAALFDRAHRSGNGVIAIFSA